ncbi:MAG: hypothetical protein WDO16_09025 [Bacteroidota bacterium]
MTKEDFWSWFNKNKASLEKFISEKNQSYDIYEALSEKLSQYSEYLIPELTINEDNKFVLVISCDGVKSGIPFVEALTDNIHNFSNWIILKYRQPGPMELIPVNDLTLNRNSIFVEWRKTPSEKYFLTFYVKGFSVHNNNYEIGTLLHMDHTIGEYNAMTRIEGVEIKKLSLFQSKKGLSSLDDLKMELDKNFA